MNDLALQFILICLVQLLLIILFRQSKNLIHRKFFTKKTMPIAQTILVIVMVVLYALFFIEINGYHKPQPLPDIKYHRSEAHMNLSPEIVEQLGGRKSSKLLNLYFLYKGSDKSVQTMSEVAKSIRGQYCASLCIINLYDDKKAFELDIQRVSIASNEIMKQWNKDNYVYVADHYLGYLDAVPDASFAYYPFHDGYYRHAKNGTLGNY